MKRLLLIVSLLPAVALADFSCYRIGDQLHCVERPSPQQFTYPQFQSQQFYIPPPYLPQVQHPDIADQYLRGLYMRQLLEGQN
jgi:hypothetical protein